MLENPHPTPTLLHWLETCVVAFSILEIKHFGLTHGTERGYLAMGSAFCLTARKGSWPESRRGDGLAETGDPVSASCVILSRFPTYLKYFVSPSVHNGNNNTYPVALP